jgi:hypothetical protein
LAPAYQVRFDVGVGGDSSHVLDAIYVWKELKNPTVFGEFWSK